MQRDGAKKTEEKGTNGYRLARRPMQVRGSFAACEERDHKEPAETWDGKLMVVALRPAGTTLKASLPRELLSLPTGLPAPNIYEVAPDGQHFLAGDLAAGMEPLNVIVNWPALLKKK